MADVTMPRLSDSMEEGTILQWLKAEGDEVKRGEDLVEIETDKATMTYQADQAGTLEIVAGEGDTLPIGEVIARIGEARSEEAASEEAPSEEAASDEAPSDEAPSDDVPSEGAPSGEARSGEAASEEAPSGEPPSGEPPSDEARSDESPSAETGQAAPAPSSDGERVKASPVARRMARELSVDLEDLRGSGPGGRIVKADVEAADGGDGAGAEREEAPAAREAPTPVAAEAEQGRAKGDTEVQELSRSQQLIARRMAESRATVPHFTLRMEIDMEEAAAVRAQLKEAGGEEPAPSYNDLVVKACALALRDFPRVNGSYRDGRFELHGRINIGVAVAVDDGLVVPTVFDADGKSLGQIARESRTLAERVRTRTVTPPELSGGTFTVSNLGMYGIESFEAVINPPQAAILAVGAVEPRAVVRDGDVVPRRTMALALSCDHRILYGADAARFLARVRELLVRPLALAL